jgi:UPF0755 protein
MKQGRIVTLVIVLLAILALGCSAEELFLEAYMDTQDEALNEPAGTDETPVTFTVDPGQSVATIGNQLEHQGLVNDAELFRRYVQAQGLDAEIQAGTYTLRQTMTIPEIVEVLQIGAVAEQQITVPEGRRLEEVAALLSRQANVPPDTFLQLTQGGWRTTDLPQKYPFLTQIPVTATLEGFLFPDTYRVPPDASAYDVVDRMLSNFDAQVTPEIRQGFAQQGLTLHEGLTMASIVEREAVIAEERATIAGVYYNRLRDGWPLSADPTVQYALGYQAEEGSWWKKQLYFVDLEVESPYNTYRNLGLPPAPIASPGLHAIRASAFPAETSYYFFMADCNAGDGSHLFAETEAEHLENYVGCGGELP